METDSHRFEPNSRIAFIDEQSNHWFRLQNQDAMSRHRSGKLKRRYERLASIALLSLEFLLFGVQAIIHDKMLGSIKPSLNSALSTNICSLANILLIHSKTKSFVRISFLCAIDTLLMAVVPTKLTIKNYCKTLRKN